MARTTKNSLYSELYRALLGAVIADVPVGEIREALEAALNDAASDGENLDTFDWLSRAADAVRDLKTHGDN